jgi:hypothetical protein
MGSLQPTIIALTPVHAERADDFEDWIRSVVVPADRKLAPEREGRSWELLRAAEDQDGIVNFAFIFRGGDLLDWDLGPLLEQALGAEEAERALANLLGMVKGEQTIWTLSSVQL